MANPPDLTLVRPRGGQTTYNQKVADTICAQLSEGVPLRTICREDGMPSESTVRTWVADDREGFAAQYTSARELGYRKMADDMIELADNARGIIGVAEARLQIETRKWLMSKALPKVYGDKLEISGNETMPLRHYVQIEMVAAPFPAVFPPKA